MKVLVINGSYKKDGMTAALIDSFLKGLVTKTRGMKVKTITLRDLKFKFCDGCNECTEEDGKKLGTCPFGDAMDEVLPAMLEADRIVFASPVYCQSETAVMKKFIERCVPLLFIGPRGPQPRNKSVKGKKGAVLLSTGVSYPRNVIFGHTRHAKNALERFCKYAGCADVSSLSAGGMESSEKTKKKFMNKAHAMGVASAR
ncbi:MAG: flavodoxin family protein [Elusimicrobia bacterium]|nr:flavodoxin family protein [Elusimicrobiota bacterium]